MDIGYLLQCNLGVKINLFLQLLHNKKTKIPWMVSWDDYDRTYDRIMIEHNIMIA